MKFITNLTNLQGQSIGGITLPETPDYCPHCHRKIHPKLHISVHLETDVNTIQTIFQCTHQSCQQVFIASYSNFGVSEPWMLFDVAPMTQQKIQFPESIEQLSPSFVQIYNQAIKAESIKLDQIVGIGIRKSFEFLIKDFAILENKHDEEAIKKLQLAECIKIYINDQNIKECAKRAVWLGNDETHYVRKWEERDISDLKILVKLTVNWIENHLLTLKYISEMK